MRMVAETERLATKAEFDVKLEIANKEIALLKDQRQKLKNDMGGSKQHREADLKAAREEIIR